MRAETRAEAAEKRVSELQAALGAEADERHRMMALLTDERAEHRRVVAALIEKLPARRRWWPWRLRP
jgi:hypothetical protein